MLNLLKKELTFQGISISPKGLIKMEKGEVPLNHAAASFKSKAKLAYNIVQDLWNDLGRLLKNSQPQRSKPPEGIENIFIHSLQGLKRMIRLYPGLIYFEEIDNAICSALCSDVNHFSYITMSKVIEFKMAIEWVGHIISKNLYIKSLITIYDLKRKNKDVIIAKGVHGPYANLDMPIQERCFSWSEISDEVAGREKDKEGQSRYTMGLEGYNDGKLNEGFVWREVRNEPFLWGKEGENPYPHRNSLWS